MLAENASACPALILRSTREASASRRTRAAPVAGTSAAPWFETRRYATLLTMRSVIPVNLVLRRRVAPSRRIDSGHDLAAVLRDADLRSPPQTRLMDNVDTTRTSETLY